MDLPHVSPIHLRSYAMGNMLCHQRDRVEAPIPSCQNVGKDKVGKKDIRMTLLLGLERKLHIYLSFPMGKILVAEGSVQAQVLGNEDKNIVLLEWKRKHASACQNSTNVSNCQGVQTWIPPHTTSSLKPALLRQRQSVL